jgi:hypothetical protein
MSNLPVDRDSEYMYNMWGTKRLVTDYDNSSPKRVIQEVMHDLAPKHNLKQQVELHEKIRNDDDYDDWEYGTEPIYDSSWIKYVQCR